tara:strand:- start:37407 stop:38519 length:1113 start_codon:yes stop_codon:yes gene_type:complete
MIIRSFAVANLRAFTYAAITPQKKINILVGHNNAGKTTLLEALSIASTLKSFKKSMTEDYIKYGQKGLKITINAIKCSENMEICIEKSLKSSNSAKVNGKMIGAKQISSMFPTISLSFGTENIVNQPSEARRSLIDWGVFHVKPESLGSFHAYTKCLKQRNFLLKTKKYNEMAYWTEQLIGHGALITQLRKDYCMSLEKTYKEHISCLQDIGNEVHQDLMKIFVQFFQGWKDNETLENALNNSLEQDKLVGYTKDGPHKADLVFLSEKGDLKKHASMSTLVISSLILMLSQCEVFHVKHGYKPALLIDDLFFGIDDLNLMLVIKLLIQANATCFLTAPDLYKDKLKSICSKFPEIDIYDIDKQEITKFTG